jgi:TRAP-type C4-dicarboxylate transport system permease small subunit
MARLIAWIERALDAVVIAGMLLIAGLVFWQFFSRFFLNFSLTWSEEVATFVMIWASLLGLVGYLRQGSLIGFEVLSMSPNRAVRMVAGFIAQTATAAFMLIMVWLGLEMSVFSDTTGVSSAAEIPLRWLYSIYWIVGAGVLIRLVTRWLGRHTA